MMSSVAVMGVQVANSVELVGVVQIKSSVELGGGGVGGMADDVLR